MHHAQSTVAAIEQVLQHIRTCTELADRIGAIHDELGSVVHDAHDFPTNTTVATQRREGKVEQTHEQCTATSPASGAPGQQHVEDYMGHLQDIGASCRRISTCGRTSRSCVQRAADDDDPVHPAQPERPRHRQPADGDGHVQTAHRRRRRHGVDRDSRARGRRHDQRRLNGIVDTFTEAKEFFGRLASSRSDVPASGPAATVAGPRAPAAPSPLLQCVAQPSPFRPLRIGSTRRVPSSSP